MLLKSCSVPADKAGELAQLAGNCANSGIGFSTRRRTNANALADQDECARALPLALTMRCGVASRYLFKHRSVETRQGHRSAASSAVNASAEVLQSDQALAHRVFRQARNVVELQALHDMSAMNVDRL
jgi:hypothetical protein